MTALDAAEQFNIRIWRVRYLRMWAQLRGNCVWSFVF